MRPNEEWLLAALLDLYRMECGFLRMCPQWPIGWDPRDIQLLNHVTRPRPRRLCLVIVPRTSDRTGAVGE